MDRREAIKTTSLILGYAVSASAIAGVMSGCLPDPESTNTNLASGWKPSFFNRSQMEQIRAMAETMLPRTETPGAVDVGVDRFIDEMAGAYYTQPEQERFVAGLAQADADCKARFGKKFVKCSAAEQFEYLEENDRTMAGIFGKLAERETLDVVPFYGMLKELVFLGYFTSGEIGEKVLQYDPIPGVYHGCRPQEEFGPRTWSY